MKVKIDYQKCLVCNTFTCVDCCAFGALKLEDKKPIMIDPSSCTECGICVDLCPEKAIIIQTKPSIK